VQQRNKFAEYVCQRKLSTSSSSDGKGGLSAQQRQDGYIARMDEDSRVYVRVLYSMCI
jgi:hypothetical protein